MVIDAPNLSLVTKDTIKIIKKKVSETSLLFVCFPLPGNDFLLANYGPGRSTFKW